MKSPQYTSLISIFTFFVWLSMRKFQVTPYDAFNILYGQEKRFLKENCNDSYTTFKWTEYINMDYCVPLNY